MTYAKFATVPCAMLAALLLCRCGAIAANIEKCDKCGKPIMLGASHICFKRPSTPSASARKAQGGAADSKENREPARAQPAKARTKRDAGDAELCFPSFSKEDIEALAKLFSYAVPTLLGMVRRRELLPPLLVIKREGDSSYFIEPIEEELRGVDDLLEYTKRRIQNDLADRTARAGQDDCPTAITAYGCAYDQRTPGFTAAEPHDDMAESGAVDDPVHDTANMALAVLGGCDASPAGVAVVQRFKPKLFGGAALLGAPVIAQGPASLLA